MRLRDVRANRPHSHSQYGDEWILRAIFDQIRTESRSALEVGAYDGVDCSNTAWCRAEGWDVTLIEADPVRYAALLETMAVDPGPFGGAPLHAKSFEFQPSTGGRVRCIEAAVTPDNIGVLVPSGLDLLSIDVDGDDLFLLEALRDDQIPRVLAIETNQSIPWWLSIRPSSLGGRFGSSVRAILDVASARGLLLVEAVGCNLVLVRATGVPNAVMRSLRGNRLEREIVEDWQAEEPSLTWLVTDYDGNPYRLGAHEPWGFRDMEPPERLADYPDVATGPGVL